MLILQELVIGYKLFLTNCTFWHFDCSGGSQLPVLEVRAPSKRQQNSPCSSQPVLLKYVGTGGKWTSAPGSNTRWRRADLSPGLCHPRQQDTNTCLQPQQTFRVSNLLHQEAWILEGISDSGHSKKLKLFVRLHFSALLKQISYGAECDAEFCPGETNTSWALCFSSIHSVSCRRKRILECLLFPSLPKHSLPVLGLHLLC